MSAARLETALALATCAARNKRHHAATRQAFLQIAGNIWIAMQATPPDVAEIEAWLRAQLAAPTKEAAC